jgi:hypothetical protein
VDVALAKMLKTTSSVSKFGTRTLDDEEQVFAFNAW